MPVTIYSRKNCPVQDAALRRCLEEVLRFSGRETALLEISLVGRKGISRLNQKYRGKKGVTDVLSFPLDSKPTAKNSPWHLGEIVIATEVAKRQARQARRTLTQQVVRLSVHGFVHLVGGDHEAGPALKRRFEAEEKKFLRYLTKKGLFRWDGSLQF